MKNAETVTFGGSGLDRAAHMRGNIQIAKDDPSARLIILWRGKLLFDVKSESLARLPLSHPVMADAGAVRVFLGLDENRPIFAVSLSRWEPVLPEAEDMNTFLDPTLQQHPTTGDSVFAELRGIMTTLTPRDAELAATARAVLGWHDSHKFCSACGTQSKAADAGWRRTCPACDTLHFPRTDPVVIMLIIHGDDVLVGRSPGWPEGLYSLLAGFVEPGETVEAAVRREVFEEAGITVGEVTYLASQPWAFPSSLMIGCYGVATSYEITLDPIELEDARWVSRSEMEQVSRGEHPMIQPARKGAIAHFLLEHWLSNKIGCTN